MSQQPAGPGGTSHMFGSVGAVHDHHDEPWHHIVDVSGPDVVSGSGDTFVGITKSRQATGKVNTDVFEDVLVAQGSC
ncbi:hypothetical protein VTL71DRAFT_2344 [Oculimacula yallundae]|uniref:Uncharacterized protein n=1 Tax=Oculimacula yallundae TaxID=86028 RepID=A0ABR4C8N2_9HELO